MQPDDSSITAVSIAASTTAFSALLVLFIGVPFLLVFETSVQSDAIAVTGGGGAIGVRVRLAQTVGGAGEVVADAIAPVDGVRTHGVRARIERRRSGCASSPTCTT